MSRFSTFADNLAYRSQRHLEEGNGVDALGRLTTIIACVVMVVALFVWHLPLFLVSVALFVYSYFRMASKNLSARRRENDAYVEFKQFFVGNSSKNKRMREQKKKYGKTHKFLKCSKCGHELMVPKGKGKIRVKCPHCGNSFEAKS